MCMDGVPATADQDPDPGTDQLFSEGNINSNSSSDNNNKGGDDPFR
jgi:hypothetical protein